MNNRFSRKSVFLMFLILYSFVSTSVVEAYNDIKTRGSDFKSSNITSSYSIAGISPLRLLLLFGVAFCSALSKFMLYNPEKAALLGEIAWGGIKNRFHNFSHCSDNEETSYEHLIQKDIRDKRKMIFTMRIR